MTTNIPTFILRHRKENLKKCSLRGLESRSDMRFMTYPAKQLPPLTGYILLTLDGPELSLEDRDSPLFLVDGTWRYADLMIRQLPPLQKRRLPSHFRTAYPRKQTACEDPDAGLSSLEALYIAYHLTGRNVEGLLDNYHWKEAFLEKNKQWLT